MTTFARAARRWLDSPRTFRVFQMIAIASLLIGLSVGVKQYRLTTCLTAYNEATNKATAQRTEAAQADRRALDDMIKTIAGARGLPPSEAGKAVSNALDGYLAARAVADQQRKSNPLPPPPSQTCD